MLSLIVASGENGELGKAGRMPWHLPADLKHFKSLTLGKPVIMGRKTYEAIGKPLPGRRNIVVSSRPGYSIPGCDISRSFTDALILAAGVPEIMVIGGGEIYRQALPRAQRIYQTRVHGQFDADTFFPKLDVAEWRELSREDHEPDARNPWPYSFSVLERRLPRNLA
ncbi:MAG: dihydrofolate reductase [Gammaproteobacteria bacterium]|nr:dihydrofolate reductase [Gammaproteobacteria bacterium]MDE2344992.1 dihydrofolate reductase [Gammaproteobacteria bacterium]